MRELYVRDTGGYRNNAWAIRTWHRGLHKYCVSYPYVTPGATEIMRELSVRKAEWYMRPGLEKCVSFLSARCSGAWDQAFRNTYMRCLSQRLGDAYDQGCRNTWTIYLRGVLMCGTRTAKIQGYSKWLSGVLTTCRTQYIWDRSIDIFLFSRTTRQVFVTLQVLYMCTLCDSTGLFEMIVGGFNNLSYTIHLRYFFI